MEILHHDEAEGGRVILRLKTGMIVHVTDDDLRLKSIPDRRQSEKKRIEWNDLLVVNDAIRSIFPPRTGESK